MTVATARVAADKAMRLHVRKDAALPVSATPLWDGDPAWPPAFWLVGAHGGAGVSALSSMIAPAGDAGRVWPAADASPLCVVVSRSDVAGLEHAHDAILQAMAGDAGDCEVVGLVVVDATPGRWPKPVSAQVDVLKELVEVWHVPYLPQLRLVGGHDRLAEWTPQKPEDDGSSGRGKKKDRRVDVTAEVAPSMQEVAEAIFSAVKKAHKNLKQGERKND